MTLLDLLANVTENESERFIYRNIECLTYKTPKVKRQDRLGEFSCEVWEVKCLSGELAELVISVDHFLKEQAIACAKGYIDWAIYQEDHQTAIEKHLKEHAKEI